MTCAGRLHPRFHARLETHQVNLRVVAVQRIVANAAVIQIEGEGSLREGLVGLDQEPLGAGAVMDHQHQVAVGDGDGVLPADHAGNTLTRMFIDSLTGSMAIG